MKFKKIILVALLLLAILTMGAVSAVEDTNDTLTADNAEELSQDLDDEVISIEETDLQTKDADDNELSDAQKTTVKNNSTDASVGYVTGTLILTDIDTGDVVRKNITLTANVNYTNPFSSDLNDTINETAKQEMKAAQNS